MATFSNVRRHFTSGQILKDQPTFPKTRKPTKTIQQETNNVERIHNVVNVRKKILDCGGNVANYVIKKFKIMFRTALHFFRSKLQEITAVLQHK